MRCSFVFGPYFVLDQSDLLNYAIIFLRKIDNCFTIIVLAVLCVILSCPLDVVRLPLLCCCGISRLYTFVLRKCHLFYFLTFAFFKYTYFVSFLNFVIILLKKRELIALFKLSSCCLMVYVLWLFLVVTWAWSSVVCDCV